MTDPRIPGFYAAQEHYDNESPYDDEEDEDYADRKGDHDRDLMEDR